MRINSFSYKFGKERPWGGKRRAIISHKRAGIYCGCILGAMALFGALLLICGTIKISSVTISGNNLYSSNLIASTSTLAEGGKYYDFDPGVIGNKLKKELPYLSNVKVKRHWGRKVSISVEEETSFYYTKHNQNYYIISADTWRIIAAASAPDVFLQLGAVYVGLPSEARVRVGEKLGFEYLTYVEDHDGSSQTIATYEKDAEETFEYVFDFIKEVKKSALASRISEIYTQDEYSLYIVLMEKVVVSLGDMTELAKKLESAATVFEKQYETITAIGCQGAAIDATHADKVTFREDPTLFHD